MLDFVATNNKPSTQREKANALSSRLIPAYGNLRLDQITTDLTDRVIAEWRSAGLSAKRVNNLNTILRRALRTAVEWKVLAHEPRIRHLRVHLPPPIYLSRNEYERLIRAAQPGFWRSFITFMLATGVRFGEAAALQWADFHLDEPSPWVFIQRAVEHGHVDEPKTQSGRRPIGLIPEAVAAIVALSKTSEWVFQTENGNFLRPGNAIIHLQRACDRAGIRRVTWHKLRHTVATELMIRGTPLLVVKDILGHKTLEMTARCAHVAPNIARDYMRLLSGGAPTGDAQSLAKAAPCGPPAKSPATPCTA